MVFRVRRYRKKAVVKKRAVTKPMISKMVKNVIEGKRKGEKVYSFTRTAPAFLLSSVAGVDTYFGLQFDLAQLPSYTEFSALYDEYKIEKVVLNFLCQSVTNYTYTNQARSYMLFVKDYDDASAPGSAAELLQRDNLIIKNGHSSFKITVYPKVARALYNGVSTAYQSGSGYIDLTYPDVPHYGLKYMIAQTQTTNNTYFQCFVTYHLKFRGVR